MFKRGDKIVCIKGYGEKLIKGGVYLLRCIIFNSKGTKITVKDKNNLYISGNWAISRFRKVTNPNCPMICIKSKEEEYKDKEKIADLQRRYNRIMSIIR